MSIKCQTPLTSHYSCLNTPAMSTGEGKRNMRQAMLSLSLHNLKYEVYGLTQMVDGRMLLLLYIQCFSMKGQYFIPNDQLDTCLNILIHTNV